MKQLLLLTVLVFFLTQNQIAQTKATTRDGKEVVLNTDGSWSYIEKPSINSEVSLECSKLISTDIDKMTGKSTTAATETLIISEDSGKTGFGIFAMNSSKSTILVIQAVGAGSCIDDDNKMNILFRDGTRLELINDGKFNCDAKMTLYFKGVFGKKKELEMLTTKEISTIRVWTIKSYVEQDFTPEQSKIFLNTMKCLSEI